MKRLTLVLMTILAFTILVPALPVFAGVHPCEATFEAKINGRSSWYGGLQLGVSLYEPEYGFCSEFTVEIWANDVEDMYAYEFTLTWDDTAHIVIVDYEVNTDYWADSIVVEPSPIYAFYLGDPTTDFYTQVAAAVAPSTGFTGDTLLATLTFHIYNDVCWTPAYWDGTVYRKKINFEFSDMKVSDSCSTPVGICTPMDGLLKIWAVQPDVMIEPNFEANCELPGKFTKTIWVSNITKMHSFCFNMSWNHYAYVGGWKEDPVSPLLYDPDVHGSDYVLDPTIYDPYGAAWGMMVPPVYPQVRVEDFSILIDEPIATYDYDWDDSIETMTLHGINWFYFCFELKDTSALLNGTFPVIEILFEKQDPWWCGRQPLYYFEQPHEWWTYPCYTDFWFSAGSFDVLCPALTYIIFGQWLGDTREDIFAPVYHDPTRAIYFEYEQGVVEDWTSNLYIFTAVPGDLNLDGIVDITDILIMASMYGADVSVYPNMYYDLDRDGDIDIFDLVIVTKNFGRTCA